jgi:glycosyltransferase involved in cell wall biosynthesis
MTGLTACLIVRDGAQTLKSCLESLGWVSEIVIVIDPRTTDASESIAKQMGAKVFFRIFDNFSAQRNYAASLSSNDWILSIDADEAISPALQKEVSSVLTRTTKSAYFIPRINIIFGKPILHTNWGPADDTHIWLYRKSQGSWQGIVHEEVQTTKSVGRLKNNKLHYSYTTVSEFMDKMNYYTSFSSSGSFSLKSFFWEPLRDFLRRYLWHLGFLDGYHGLFLSYLMVVYHLSEIIKLWRPKNLS